MTRFYVLFILVAGALCFTLQGCASDSSSAPSVATPSEDDALQAAIIKSWQQDYPALIGRVSVSVSQSVVLLNGTVATPQMRIDALRSTWAAEGVHEVVNEIQLINAKGSDYLKDDLAAIKLRGKLTFDPDIDSTHYSIEAIKDTIYIIGIAKDTEEEKKVEQLAYGIKGVHKVVSYVTVKSAP